MMLKCGALAPCGVVEMRREWPIDGEEGMILGIIL
jgi:hypothetical protein